MQTIHPYYVNFITGLHSLIRPANNKNKTNSDIVLEICVSQMFRMQNFIGIQQCRDTLKGLKYFSCYRMSNGIVTEITYFNIFLYR